MTPGHSPTAGARGALSAGQMTAVMRAVRTPNDTAGPMVLRIGVVRAGRIVEERVIEQRAAVTVGASEDATFVVPSLPSTFELFGRKGNAYVLRVRPQMRGRIAFESEIVELATLAGTDVKLTEHARGKVTLGDTTLLFQFVRPLPKQARPQLPLSVKGGLTGQIDWSLTIIAAMSFLLHFGIVGAMYSDWMDVVADDNHSVAGIVDMMQRIPPPPAVETPSDTPNTTAPAPEPVTKAATPTSTPTKTTGTTGSTTKSTSSSSASDKQVASLLAQADAIEVGLLIAPNGKSSVDRALRRSEIPPVDLSSRAADGKGIADRGDDLRVRGSGPVIAQKPGSLGTLGGPTHGTSSDAAGDARDTAGPKLEPKIGTLSGSTTVTGADRVIAGLKGRFRACYQKGLAIDPNMSGKVIISAKIGPNGEVTSADVASSSGLSPEVGACIASAVKRAQFDPQAGTTSLSVPVSFVRSN